MARLIGKSFTYHGRRDTMQRSKKELAMSFLERAWNALMAGNGAKAAEELQHNEIARIRPVQGLAASFERMGTEWSIAWLDMPNTGLRKRTPRETLVIYEPDSWHEVWALFRARDLRFEGHMDALRDEARRQHDQARSEEAAMSESDDEPNPAVRRDLSHLYRIWNPELTAAVLGRRCADARQALGLSIADAADRCGIARSELARFEETGDISLQDALQVIRALSMSTGFDDAFRMPRFASIDDMRESARLTADPA